VPSEPTLTDEECETLANHYARHIGIWCGPEALRGEAYNLIRAAFALAWERRGKADEKIVRHRVGGVRDGCCAAELGLAGDAIERSEEERSCDHKFVDSKSCLKCGWTPGEEERP